MQSNNLSTVILSDIVLYNKDQMEILLFMMHFFILLF